MGLAVSDLVLESVLREGLTALRKDPEIMDDIFSRLIDLFPKKYGQKEINRIKEFILNKEIYVVHAFTQVVGSLPCISIQLMDDTEDKNLAYLGDFAGDIQEALDEQELLEFVKVNPVVPLSYDPLTGVLNIDDGIDLENVNPGYIYVDYSGSEYEIIGGINNLPGAKKVTLKKRQNVDLASSGSIKSPINTKQYEHQGVHHMERLILGIHTEERLLTRYIYIIVKYILLARKLDLIRRHFKLATLSGSDFTRNMDYGEPVFSRYLTVTGLAPSEWRADQVQPVDNIDLSVLVNKDIADTEDLGLKDSTVRVSDED